MSPSPSASPVGPLAAVTAVSWLLVLAVASLICGILSLLLIGASSAGLLPSGWSYALSVACGVIGVVFCRLARARDRRGAPDSCDAGLATAGLLLSYGGTLLSLALFAVVAFSLQFAEPFPPGNESHEESETVWERGKKETAG